MSELKEHLFVPYSELQGGDELTDAITIAKSYYLKSEADKVIADLEESHKMEVEQLLMEIVKLKGQYKDMDVTHSVHIAKMNAKIDKLEEDVAWNKYKRCLAMADYCYTNVHCIMGHRLCAFSDRKKEWFERWHNRWLELAEKFKELKK